MVQSALTLQELGQVTMAPLHRYGSQAGSPAVPISLATQIPALPGTSQASQALTQLVLQQKPSMQWPLWHSLLPPHGE